MGGDLLVSGVVQATPDKLRSSYSVMTYHKEGPTCGRIPYDPASSEARPCQQSCRDGLRISVRPESSKSPVSIAQSNKQWIGVWEKDFRNSPCIFRKIVL